MVHDRYQVIDPELKELVTTFPDKQTAIDRARRESAVRKNHMLVYDAMARRGSIQTLRVEPARIIVAGRKALAGTGGDEFEKEIIGGAR